jgi:thioredoxin-related protein
MKIIMVLNILLTSFVCGAQQVEFKKLSDWNQVLDSASKENKYIFVDCFTTWCGSCKKMDSEIFKNALVANFLNQNYISIKIQFDSAAKDNVHIQNWFHFSKDFGKANDVNAFPTFLFFKSNGKLVSKETGSNFTPKEFVTMLESKLDINRQFYTIKEQYLKGDRSADLIRNLLPEAVKIGDMKIAYEIHDQYICTIDTPYTTSQLAAIYSSMTDIRSAGFPIILSYVEKNSSLLPNKGFANIIVKSLINQEMFKLYIQNKGGKIDWTTISKHVGKISSSLSNQIVMEMQIEEANREGDWENMGRIKMDYYDKYAASFDHNAKFVMNNELMDIFLKCYDKQTLLRAAIWSKTTINRVTGEESPSCMDTYANLLYKAGKRNDALIWQERAFALASKQGNHDLASYLETLKKMKNGEKTWSIENPH